MVQPRKAPASTRSRGIRWTSQVLPFMAGGRVGSGSSSASVRVHVLPLPKLELIEPPSRGTLIRAGITTVITMLADALEEPRSDRLLAAEDSACAGAMDSVETSARNHFSKDQKSSRLTRRNAR